MRPFRTLGSTDQWWRAHHDNTVLDTVGGVVSLKWRDPPPNSDEATGLASDCAGLAFDSRCRLYHVRNANVVRVRWAVPRNGGAPPRPEEAVLTPPTLPAMTGGFRPMTPARHPVALRGVAVDQDDRLFVGAGRQVHVFDLWNRRHLRSIRLPTPVVDLVAAAGPSGPGPSGPGPSRPGPSGPGRVWALSIDGAVHRLTARGTPVRVQAPLAAPASAQALAVALDGQPFVLLSQPSATIQMGDTVLTTIPGATDLVFDADGILVVARQPGQAFLRWRLIDGGLENVPPLKARGYDGAGIALAPDGRIVYRTATRGLRHARPARLEYEAAGRVVSFRLDSGQYRTAWGRLFLDACIPQGTAVRVHCVATDEMPDGPQLAGTGPGNLSTSPPALSAPPPQLPVQFDDDVPGLPLVRRAERELPWAAFAANDPFTTYEAHADAARGRYLWITLQLQGDTRKTPQVRMVRVESPGHRQLDRLPAVYRRDPAHRDFLQRFLALFDGVLHELELRSLMRLALVDPHATPAELLPWLASFLGLVLDERWTEPARRQLIAEAARLFRGRGTLGSLQRWLELALGHLETEGPTPVTLIEQYRFRGLGAAVGETGSTRAVLGGGFRVGGAIGVEGDAPIEDAVTNAFALHAHRFTVLLQAQLDPARRAMIEDLLAAHAPAHTVWTLCSADAGMRIGRGLHVGLTSIIGPTGGFDEALVGDWQLGTTDVIGRATPGMRVGTGRIG